MERAVVFQPSDYTGLFPEYILLGSVVLICTIAFFSHRRAGGIAVWISILALASAFLFCEDSGNALFPSGLQSQTWTPPLKRFFLISAAACLFSWLEWKQDKQLKNSPLFFALLLLACLSLLLLVQASGYWMMLLSAEGFSFCSYALVYNQASEKPGDKAILRYFGTGALATGISVFGLSWLIGFEGISMNGNEGFGSSIAFFPVAGAVFFLAFLLFKLGGFPFQFWIPDVYASAPAPVSGFLASAPKAAAAFACFNLSQMTQVNLGFPLLCFALISGIFGNLAAFQSKHLKELLSYSAIGQASFLLIPAVFARQIPGAAMQLLYFAMVYGVAIQGSFACCQYFERIFGNHPEIKVFSGSFRKFPLAAILLTGFLVSIIGLPPFAGFTAKLLIVSGLPAGIGLMGNIWPAAAFFLGLMITVMAAGYFFRLPYQLFFGKNESKEAIAGKSESSVVQILMVLGLLFQIVAFFMPGVFVPFAL